MEKYYDVTAVGESLIDVIVRNDRDTGGLIMEGNPGGAPLNVLAAAVKLGLDAAFIGKISTDAFGKYLTDTIEDCGISKEGIVFTDKELTTLAMVTLDDRGDRSFSFYRNGTADVMLESGELNTGLIGRSRVLHFGSVSMTAEPSKSATLAAAKYARDNGVMVSYDPNLRERLWDNLDNAKKAILEGMKLADVVKISGEELEFLTEDKDIEQAARELRDAYGLKLLTVTLGAEGAAVLAGDTFIRKPTYSNVSTIDTTGAGDAFWGAFLYCLVKSGKRAQELDSQELERFLDFANAAGSLSTTKKGAIPAMPEKGEIESLVEQSVEG